MKLSDAAIFFDKVSCQDAFNPTVQFFGQLDVFDDSRRDGATVVRRILSVEPTTVIPARRILAIHNEYWIVGTHQPDSFRGSVLRDKYILQRAAGACSIRTAAQALSTGGLATYCAKLWVKDMKEIEISSKLSGFFNLYFSSTEAVLAGNIITVQARDHIVRNTFLSAAGFLVAESDELVPGAAQAATFTPYTYTPATDALGAGTPVVVQVLRLRFQDEYEYLSEAAEKLAPGDIRVLIIKGVTLATPKPGDRLALTDGSWAVHSVSDEGGTWGLHLRKGPS